MAHFPKITLILPAHFSGSISGDLHQLFGAGLKCLWLRGSRMNEDVALYHAIDPDLRERLLLPFETWQAVGSPAGIYGVHFPGHALPFFSEKELENLKQQCGRLSTSIHSLAELINLSPVFSQVMVSPLFDSISKVGYAANAEIWKAVTLRPEIAKIGLGGIDADNALEVFDSDFQGIALLGSIWEASDPLAEWKKFQEFI